MDRLDAGGVDEGWEGLCKDGAEGPILQTADVAFKDRVDDGVFVLRGGDQAVDLVVGPVDVEIRRVRDEPVLEAVVLVIRHQLVSHSRPRNVFDPRGMRVEDLRRRRSHPFRHPFVVFRRRVDLPPHLHEHAKQHRNLLREIRNVGEFTDDVRHELRQWVQVVCCTGVEQ